MRLKPLPALLATGIPKRAFDAEETTRYDLPKLRLVAAIAGSAIHTFMMNHAARLDVRIQVRSFNAVTA